MAKCLVGVAGGISANDKGKLIPENIRAGVTLFEGTSKQIEGGFFPDPVLFAYAGNRGNSMATCMVIDEACGLYLFRFWRNGIKLMGGKHSIQAHHWWTDAD